MFMANLDKSSTTTDISRRNGRLHELRPRHNSRNGRRHSDRHSGTKDNGTGRSTIDPWSPWRLTSGRSDRELGTGARCEINLKKFDEEQDSSSSSPNRCFCVATIIFLGVLLLAGAFAILALHFFSDFFTGPSTTTILAWPSSPVKVQTTGRVTEPPTSQTSDPETTGDFSTGMTSETVEITEGTTATTTTTDEEVVIVPGTAAVTSDIDEVSTIGQSTFFEPKFSEDSSIVAESSSPSSPQLVTSDEIGSSTTDDVMTDHRSTGHRSTYSSSSGTLTTTSAGSDRKSDKSSSKGGRSPPVSPSISNNRTEVDAETTTVSSTIRVTDVPEMSTTRKVIEESDASERSAANTKDLERSADTKAQTGLVSDAKTGPTSRNSSDKVQKFSTTTTTTTTETAFINETTFGVDLSNTDSSAKAGTFDSSVKHPIAPPNQSNVSETIHQTTDRDQSTVDDASPKSNGSSLKQSSNKTDIVSSKTFSEQSTDATSNESNSTQQNSTTN